jgi:hypothetical protein
MLAGLQKSLISELSSSVTGAHQWRGQPNQSTGSPEAVSGGRPVRRPLLFRATLLMAACVLACGSGCGVCNPRHGTIIRGNWSLECNRVPWLTSSPLGNGEGGCATDVMAPAGTGEVGVPVACAPDACPPGAMACHTCAHAGPTGPAPPPQQMGHSRFHPVPTRPVFTPWKCPTVRQVKRTRSPQAPRQLPHPEPEIIPTPRASFSAMQPTLASRSATNAAWIFQPEDASVPTVASRH